jgi:hypothetical protein
MLCGWETPKEARRGAGRRLVVLDLERIEEAQEESRGDPCKVAGYNYHSMLRANRSEPQSCAGERPERELHHTEG